jgi:hypothetical protein
LAEAQKSAQKAACAAAADKEAGEKRLQDCEAKIQDIMRQLKERDDVIK